MTLQSIALLAILFIYLLIAFYFIWAMMFGVPFYPTHKKDIKSMLNYLPKNKKLKVVELGAGDGRISMKIAKLGYQVTAIEYNSFLSLVIRLRNLFNKNKVEVINGDFYKIDLNKYDVFVAYLFPHAMDKLEPIIFSQANKGKIVISNTFQFKNNKPKENVGKVYLYEVK